MANKAIRICLILLLLAALPLTALAQEFDPSATGSISISLKSKDTNKPLEGAELSLFYVASVEMAADGSLHFFLAGDFAYSGISLDDPNLLAKLDAFVTDHDIDCRTSITNSQGSAVWNGIPLGLYFVKQTSQVQGFAPCTPFLVTVPLETEDGFVYRVDASPKTDVARLVDITIRKVWNTDKSAPGSERVTVQLLRGDVIVDTAILNHENDWQITYTNLPESDAYHIKEVSVPKGFTATYSNQGYVFTVTNTPSLAQTGQLVWPIPIFAIAGVVFLMMGFAILRKTGKAHE